MSKYEISLETLADYRNRIEKGLDISEFEMLCVIYMRDHRDIYIGRFDFFGHRQNEERWRKLNESMDAACLVLRHHIHGLMKTYADVDDIELGVDMLGGYDEIFEMKIRLMPCAKAILAAEYKLKSELDYEGL